MTNPSDVLPHDPSYNLKAHVARVQQLHGKYALNTTEKCERHSADLLAPFFTTKPPWVVGDQMLRLVDQLLADNDIYIPDPPTLEYRPYLMRLQEYLTTDNRIASADTALTAFLKQLVAAFPPTVFNGEDKLRKHAIVPLIDLLPDATRLPYLIYEHFFKAEYARDRYTFASTRRQLTDNIIRASGYHPDTYEKGKLVGADEARGTPAEIAARYLAGTPFLDLFFALVPFVIPQTTRFEHTHIVAGPGHGKTQTLQHLIAGDLTADAPPALVVIDSQGDLIRKIERLALFAPHAKLADRLVIIDPTDTKHPPALNLFDIDRSRFGTYDEAAREQIENGTIELYDYIFGSLLGAELTQKQSVIFRYLARLMLSIPNATIHDLVRLLQDPTPYLHHIESLPAGARSFFETEFNDRKEFAGTKKQILRRLWGILEQPSFERMFTQPKNRIDMFDALNTGKIVLVNTAKDFLKAERSSLFGRTFIALTLQAALERAPIPEKKRRPAFLIIDEAHEYFDQNIDELLTQARKYKVGLVLAHQYLDQLTPSLRASLAATTSIKMAGGVSDKDARALAGDMRATPDFIAAQRKTDQQTSFATYVRNLTTSGAVSLSVPFFTLEGMATMSDAHHAELREKNRARYTTPAASASLTTEAHRSASPTTDTSAPDDDWRS